MANKSRKGFSPHRLDERTESILTGILRDNLRERHLVLYNASGTNMNAAYLDREELSLPLIVEHKVYWDCVRSREEAHFLVGILNSTAVNEAIKPLPSMGLLGERDIEKKVLDAPFPAYDAGKVKHRDLVRLSAKARECGQALIKKAELPNSLGMRRAAVREEVKEILEETDPIVRTLI